MLEVSSKMGRHFWREHRAALDDDAWERPHSVQDSPQQSREHRELFAALRRAIDEDLTELQRRVFVAIALNEVPMDAFARELGASRNAIYKSLFDARVAAHITSCPACHEDYVGLRDAGLTFGDAGPDRP